jgi:hypothetical protein
MAPAQYSPDLHIIPKNFERLVKIFSKKAFVECVDFDMYKVTAFGKLSPFLR